METGSREEKDACPGAVAVAVEDRPELEAFVELTLTTKAGLLPADDYARRMASARVLCRCKGLSSRSRSFVNSGG